MEKKKKQTADQIDDAKRLRSLYESKKTLLGLTQQHIADALDISQGAVGHYLHGRNPLNLSVVAKFAELLQVSISDISPTLSKEASPWLFAGSPFLLGRGGRAKRPQGR